MIIIADIVQPLFAIVDYHLRAVARCAGDDTSLAAACRSELGALDSALCPAYGSIAAASAGAGSARAGDATVVAETQKGRRQRRRGPPSGRASPSASFTRSMRTMQEQEN